MELFTTSINSNMLSFQDLYVCFTFQETSPPPLSGNFINYRDFYFGNVKKSIHKFISVSTDNCKNNNKEHS